MKNLTIILFSILFILGCSDADPLLPVPSENQQTKIIWSSLYNSAWPMNHGDPQSTGRSSYPGPKNGQILWTAPAPYLQTSAALGNNCILFVPSGISDGLYSVDMNGSLLWKSSLKVSRSENQTTPIIDKNNIIYTADFLSGKLYAFNSIGEILWIYETGNSVAQKGIILGLDGTLYFVDANSKLHAVNTSDGSLSWAISDSRFNSSSNTALTFSPDGKILYIPGNDLSVIAVNTITRTVKWTFGTSTNNSVSMVDSKGNLYLNGEVSGIPSFISLTSEGEVRWSIPHNNRELMHFSLDPTIDTNGNIYFAFDSLYSISYTGKINWIKDMECRTESPLVSDSENNVYVCATDFSNGIVLKYDSKGNHIWRLNIPAPDIYPYSPVLTSDGKMVVCSWRGENIFLIN